MRDRHSLQLIFRIVICEALRAYTYFLQSNCRDTSGIKYRLCLTNTNNYAIINSESEVSEMAKKKKNPYAIKMNSEQLQLYFYFKKRGGSVAVKKGKGSYDRKKIKMEKGW